MVIKYLDIDSTRRNRQQWPLSGQFQVLVSHLGSKTSTTADDPVSNATPIVSWASNNFNQLSTGSASITGTINTVEYGASSPTNNIILTLTPSTGQLQQAANYYKNALITIGGASVRILNYQYLGNNKGQFTIANVVSPTVGSTAIITDPTDLMTLRVFVPGLTTPISSQSILYDETTNNYASIVNYDSETGLVTTASAIPGWSVTDLFSIRQSPPSYVGTTDASSTTTSIGLGPNIGVNLVGSFIRIKPTYPIISPDNELRRIVNYDTTTNIATVSPGFTSSPASMAYELLSFSYDNHNCFVYTGSAQNEPITYSITLKSLILPNLELKSGYGGKIWKYPYVYVELSSINSSTNNLISSTNPNATRMLFKASVGNFDMTRPVNYVLLKGDEMTQRVKFQIETNFNFSIRLPNGDVFETELQDTIAPAAPNPLVQISTLFEIMRE
jgi:hypothetical protein